MRAGSGRLLKPISLPIGSASPKNAVATDSLMIATRVDDAVSWFVKSRPRTNRMPNVSKYPGVTVLARTWFAPGPGGAAGKPRTRPSNAVSMGLIVEHDAARVG